MMLIINSKELFGSQMGCQICGNEAERALRTLNIQEGKEDTVDWIYLCETHYGEILNRSAAD